MYFVYILSCNDGSLYTGTTNDIGKRMKVHESGKGSKYVRARSPFKLVYSEEVENKSVALKREFEIKKMKREDKIQMISLTKLI